MTSHFFLRAAVAAAVFVATFPARAQMTTPDNVLSQPIDSLAAWDRNITMLTQMSWNISATAAGLGTDHAARTIDSYWNDSVLTAEAKNQLDELHARAVAQTNSGDEEGLKRTIAEAAPLIRAQLYRSFLVIGYWGMQDSIAYQVKLLQPWLDRAPPEERKTVSARADAGYEALKKAYAFALESKQYSVAPGSAAGKLLTTTGEAVQSLDAERNSLVKQQASLPNPIEIAPLKREEPCTLSIAPKPGSSKAVIAVSEFPSSEPYYPAEMKRRGVSGNVVVRVDVSTKGCADAASIVGSSGVKELDQAGLKYAMAGHYVPASEADEAVPGQIVFRVAFQLRDGAPPPPAP